MDCPTPHFIKISSFLLLDRENCINIFGQKSDADYGETSKIGVPMFLFGCHLFWGHRKLQEIAGNCCSLQEKTQQEIVMPLYAANSRGSFRHWRCHFFPSSPWPPSSHGPSSPVECWPTKQKGDVPSFTGKMRHFSRGFCGQWP